MAHTFRLPKKDPKKREDTPRPTPSENASGTGFAAALSGRDNWSYQCILDQRIHNGHVQYLVEWTPTWEDADSISNLDQAVADYEEMERCLEQGSINDEGRDSSSDCDCSVCGEPASEDRNEAHADGTKSR
jgi:hypothetical protein